MVAILERLGRCMLQYSLFSIWLFLYLVFCWPSSTTRAGSSPFQKGTSSILCWRAIKHLSINPINQSINQSVSLLDTYLPLQCNFKCSANIFWLIIRMIIWLRFHVEEVFRFRIQLLWWYKHQNRLGLISAFNWHSHCWTCTVTEQTLIAMFKWVGLTDDLK